MYGLSAFCFVCLSMDKKKTLNEISDLSIFHILNSCSYDTKWMEDSFTMHICHKCHNQLYSVYEFNEMCRKNSSLLQGYVELLKQGRNDRQMAKMEVVIDPDSVENKSKDDINVNMVSTNDTMIDPIRELSLKHELDAEQSFMNIGIDIKHEPLILNSELNHVQIIDKSDQETTIRNEKHCFAAMQTSNETPTACKNIKIEHIRDHNEILVTNVLDEDHNIKTQFSSHSEAIYINNIENNAVQNSSFNKVYLQNPIDPFERMCSEMQRRGNDQNYKIQLPVFSNVNECLVQKGAEDSFNQTICSTQNKVGLSGCELEQISDKMTSELTDNPIKRTEYNRRVKKSKKPPLPNSTDNMFYIMMPIVPTIPTLPVPNIPVMNPVPINNNKVVKSADNSVKNTIPLAATNNYVRNWKRKLEPPRKCDICQKTYDSHDGLRLHLVTHSGMKTVTPERTLMQGTQVNKNETFETMFIKHMVRSGTL